MSGPAVELTGITKRYPGVLANDGVEFRAEWGEVHALVGENGAGKTTLMRVLGGLTRPDAGVIRVDGRAVSLHSAADAAKVGIGMVHQHPALVPVFTVLENVVLGSEPPLYSGLGAERERIRTMAAGLGVTLDPDAKVEDLSVGERQRVEIVRVLLRGARILVLDEPTDVLTPAEAADLYRSLRLLAREGRTVLFISHRLSEVLAASDRVTVLRRGRTEGTLDTEDATEAGLARLMVGREVLLDGASLPRSERPGKPMLTLEGLAAESDRGLPVLSGVSLSVRSSEVLGIAGVMGNGQSELFEVLAGVRPATAGTVKGEPGAGIAWVPEDRLDQGLVADLSVEENIALGIPGDHAIWRGPVLSRRGLRSFAAAKAEEFGVTPASPVTAVRDLSGGNQQKVLLLRALAGTAEVLLLAEPSRGLDVLATERVGAAILAARDRGAAVLLVSSDLSELLRLSDRIVVMRRGRISGEVRPGDTTEEELGILMAGGES